MNKCLILLIPILISCQNRMDNYKKFKLSLNKCLTNYYVTNDKKYLLEGYDILQKDNDFKENGITKYNQDVVIPILFSLKRYDELEKLLINNKVLNQYNCTNILNMVRALKYSKINKNKSNTYIYESIKIIQDSMKKVPKDSLLYADYFTMRMYLNGKERVLEEIDSMQKVNKNYSKLFYENILKELIEEHPKELLPK